MTVIDITQRTPLHYSVLTRVESRDVVTSLTQSNTCFFMTDRWGFIPLQYAILQRFDVKTKNTLTHIHTHFIFF